MVWSGSATHLQIVPSAGARSDQAQTSWRLTTAKALPWSSTSVVDSRLVSISISSSVSQTVRSALHCAISSIPPGAFLAISTPQAHATTNESGRKRDGTLSRSVCEVTECVRFFYLVSSPDLVVCSVSVSCPISQSIFCASQTLSFSEKRSASGTPVCIIEHMNAKQSRLLATME